MNTHTDPGWWFVWMIVGAYVLTMWDILCGYARAHRADRRERREYVEATSFAGPVRSMTVDSSPPLTWTYVTPPNTAYSMPVFHHAERDGGVTCGDSSLPHGRYSTNSWENVTCPACTERRP